MRTTLTLDKDVPAVLERLRNARGDSMRALINEALREGLKKMEALQRTRARFRTSSVNVGRCRLGNVDNVADVLAVAEGDSFR